MSGRSTGGTGPIVALVLVGVALVFFGLRTERVETVETPTFPYDPTTQGDLGPIVVGTSVSGGFSLFDLQLSAPDHAVSVRFLAPPECAPLLSGVDAWPPALVECGTPFNVSGTIDGLGTAPNGRSLIGVAIPVSAECAAAVELGSVWPPANPACSSVPNT